MFHLFLSDQFKIVSCPPPPVKQGRRQWSTLFYLVAKSEGPWGICIRPSRKLDELMILIQLSQSGTPSMGLLVKFRLNNPIICIQNIGYAFKTTFCHLGRIIILDRLIGLPQNCS